ncbi:MAG: hypothetical protein ACE5Q6_09385 [Dehalococcoidia bacterium]
MTNPMFELPAEEPERRPRRSQHQEEERFVSQFMYLLTGPYITWPGWEDLAVKRKDDILLYRLAHAREIFEQQLCTEFEAMLYVSTASMEHPMNHDWTEIYMWLFRRWNPEQADEIELNVRELDNNQLEQLNRLRRWLFQRQMNHLKAKQRDANRKEVEEEQRRLEAQQPRMFELPGGE